FPVGPCFWSATRTISAATSSSTNRMELLFRQGVRGLTAGRLIARTEQHYVTRFREHSRDFEADALIRACHEGHRPRSSIRASAEQQMLTADERREIAREVLGSVCHIVHRSHARYRSVRLHGVAVRPVSALAKDSGTIDRCRQDRVDGHALMA